MSNDARKSWSPPPQTPAATPSAGPQEPIGLEASWESCREDAARVDARDVVAFKPNASVVLHNVRAGVAAVLAERPWFESQPDAPRVDFARVDGALTAAEALVFVATRAAAMARATPVVRTKIARARRLLRLLRGAAESLVAAGVFTAEEVPAVGGRGPIATARACVAYAALFRAKHARTRGLTAVKSEQVREAAALGSELLREVKPRGVARGARPEAERVAADDRDRVAVVVARRYDYVERVAAWRWGRSCEAIVPTMLSRTLPRGAGDEDDLDDEEAIDETDDDEEAIDETDDDAEDDASAEEDEGADDDAPEPAAAKPAAAKPAAAKPAARKRVKR